MGAEAGDGDRIIKFEVSGRHWLIGMMGLTFLLVTVTFLWMAFTRMGQLIWFVLFFAPVAALLCWVGLTPKRVAITIHIKGQEPYKISAADTFGHKKMLRVRDGIEHYGKKMGFETEDWGR